MRFWTIITMPAMTFSEKLYSLRDWAAQEIGRKLPVRVRYWVTLQEIGRATMTHHHVPAATVDYVIKNLDHPELVR